MSQEQLIGAYLDGRVSRRVLIRRLVAGGISLGAAVSYAHLLSPERAAAQTADDFYPSFNVEIISTSLSGVRRKERLVVKVRTNGPDTVSLHVYVKDGGTFQKIGARGDIVFTEASRNFVEVTIDPTLLENRDDAKIRVVGLADNAGVRRDTELLIAD